jgi:hypothetical protein
VSNNNTPAIDGERKFLLRLVDAATYQVVDMLPRSEWEHRKAAPGEVIAVQRQVQSAGLHIDATKRRPVTIGDLIPKALLRTTFRTGKALDARLTEYKTQRKAERAAFKTINSVKVL